MTGQRLQQLQSVYLNQMEMAVHGLPCIKRRNAGVLRSSYQSYEEKLLKSRRRSQRRQKTKAVPFLSLDLSPMPSLTLLPCFLAPP